MICLDSFFEECISKITYLEERIGHTVGYRLLAIPRINTNSIYSIHNAAAEIAEFLGM